MSDFEENIRGAVRSKPDPMAMDTQGRVTTYEALEQRGAGIKIGPRPVNSNVRVRLANRVVARKR